MSEWIDTSAGTTSDPVLWLPGTSDNDPAWVCNSDFVYNNEDEEPEIFPGIFPNLLANGASGIAVGMATSIPSHNVAEIVDATLLLIDNPHAEHAPPMDVFPGPDGKGAVW